MRYFSIVITLLMLAVGFQNCSGLNSDMLLAGFSGGSGGNGGNGGPGSTDTGNGGDVDLRAFEQRVSALAEEICAAATTCRQVNYEQCKTYLVMHVNYYNALNTTTVFASLEQVEDAVLNGQLSILDTQMESCTSAFNSGCDSFAFTRELSVEQVPSVISNEPRCDNVLKHIP
jgi:hypothetical protein